MSYIDWLPPMKLLNPLATWSCRIMWQTKTIISPLKQCLWLLNLALYLPSVNVPVPFYSNFILCKYKVMLIYILINIQDLQNIIFSFEIGSIGEYISSLDYHHSMRKSPQQNFLFPPTC